MKNDRQEKLLQIISEENIETQEQLLQRLEARGIRSTQATISRDIKQLHLIKEPTGFGTYRYAVSTHRTRLNFAEKLRNIFRECVLSVDYAQNLVVIKTMAGLAGAAASALDGMDALLSTVQMPTGIPVATVAINGGANAALLAAQILAVSDSDLAKKLDDKRKKDANKVLEKDAGILEKL